MKLQHRENVYDRENVYVGARAAVRILPRWWLAIVGALLAVAVAATAHAQASDTAQPGGTLPGAPAIELVKVADGLADPIHVAMPSGDDRLFVVERIGRIRIVDADGTLLEEPFLDISGTVKTDFLEQGLLGLAFHPNYAENGRFFVYYADFTTNGDTFLVEYSVASDDPNRADPGSAKVLLSHDQPYVNHNGGTILFGPEGFLYIAMGDGGLAGDPYGNAQDISTLLGSILRIDVDAGGTSKYAIPDDNPFAGGVTATRPEEAAFYHPNAAPEIWAYGLRNPWQFSFDAETGDLYIVDVGQNQWEEVNYQPADSAGGLNYGWDFLEASHCYPASQEECGPLGVLPVAEYSHEDGSCSITGGGVYRGEAAGLNGVYLNSDYCSGKVWGLTQGDGGWVYAELLDTELQVAGAGTDNLGNIYFTSCACEYSRGYDPTADPQGAVWRVASAETVPADAETAPTAGAASGSDDSSADRGDDAAAAANEIEVGLTEWEINMPNELPAGATTFMVSNNGSFPHNLEIEGRGIERALDADLEPGESGSITVELEPGVYRVYCPVGNHAQEGMEMTLTVS